MVKMLTGQQPAARALPFALFVRERGIGLGERELNIRDVRPAASLFDVHEGADLPPVRVLGVNDDAIDRRRGENQLPRRSLRRSGCDDAAVLKPVRGPVRPASRLSPSVSPRRRTVSTSAVRRTARWVLPGSVTQGREPDGSFQFTSVSARSRAIPHRGDALSGAARADVRS